MCGRFTLRTPAKQIALFFDFVDELKIPPRFNIAPSQNVLAVRRNIETGNREPVELKWGLIPFWSESPSFGAKAINARADGITSKPAFRGAIKSRRCLVASDGFYEWKAIGAKKQPYLIQVNGGELFAFAGLWEKWSREGQTIESCTIITTDANERMKQFHDRMPVILPKDRFDDWLAPGVLSDKKLSGLLTQYPGEKLSFSPVSTWVNNARHEDSKCIEPVVE